MTTRCVVGHFFHLVQEGPLNVWGRDTPLEPRCPCAPRPEARAGPASAAPSRPPSVPWALGPPPRCPRGQAHPAQAQPPAQTLPRGSLGHRGVSRAAARPPRAKSPSWARRLTDGWGRRHRGRGVYCAGRGVAGRRQPQASRADRRPPRPCALGCAAGSQWPGRLPRRPHGEVALPPRSVHAAVTLFAARFPGGRGRGRGRAHPPTQTLPGRHSCLAQ